MRRAGRLSGAVAGCALAALLLGGCSSSGEDDEKGTPSGAPSAPARPSDGAKAADLVGAWKNDAQPGDNDLRILTISKSKAMLTGKTTCAGTVEDSGGDVRLDLTCPDGSDEFARGVAEASEDGSLTVSWESGTADRFTKAEGTPSRLPSTLPSDVPTGAPGDTDERLPDLEG